MPNTKDLPLLLLDNSNMMTVLNEGTFMCHNLTFEEARAILAMHDSASILKCFADREIERVMFEHLGIEKREYEYKKIRNMRVGQDAIVFKLYSAPSASQPIVEVDGAEAKKIFNTYVYCQILSRTA